MEGRAWRSPVFSFSAVCRACPESRPVILERRRTKELSRLALARFANKAQRAAGLRGEVNILLTGDAEMQRLNLQFRHKDTATDVLSFPRGNAAAGNAALPAAGAKAGNAALPAAGAKAGNAAVPAAGAGDIAISIQRARAQAAAIGHDLLTEVKVLILHGMLHLAGHDHESDGGQMREFEQKLRAELNLFEGLIERTDAAPRRGRRRR